MSMEITSRPRSAMDDAQIRSFPEGWFRVGYSGELSVGQVVALRYFDRALVLFRTEAGAAQVLDAHCAHLGAHLGVGGTVVGDTIRCPFHAWHYGTDGACKLIPYSKHIPKAATVTSWPTVERSGLVLMWYSAAGNPPQWQPPDLPEYGQPNWTKEYACQRYTIRSNPQEILENVADVAHAPYVHGNPCVPEAQMTFERHIFKTVLKIDLPGVGGATANTVEAHGLGLVVNASDGHGAKRFWTTYTPIDIETVEVHFCSLSALSTPEDPTGEISAQSVRATWREFEKDIPIWENKIYRANPLVCPGDGPIGRYRVWASKFYPTGPT